MTEATNPQQTTQPPNEEPWREKYLRQYMQLQGLGYQSMMLDKIMRQNAIARDLAQRTADGTLGQPRPAGEGNAEEDMGIRIGDEIHHHHHADIPPPPAAAPPATPARGMSTLGKVAVGAAMLATGGIGGAAATTLLAPDAVAPPAVTRPSGPDTDTRYRLEVSSEPPPESL